MTTSTAAAAAGGERAFLAPVSGVVIPLDQVPDPTFAQRLAGEGVAIDPLGDRVLAPCDARVLQVHRARHAIALDADGIELLIHVGLDTFALGGEGFTPLVQAGDVVRAGDALLAFDADVVARRARSLITVFLVTNPQAVGALRHPEGAVAAGRDVLLRVAPRDAAAGVPAAVSATGADEVTSAPVVVAAAGGLHARPAAQVVAAARRFGAELRLLKNGREANARSVVSIMALEAGLGDRLTVSGRGGDARAAVEALAALLSTDFGEAHAPARAESAPVPADPEGDREPGVLRGVPASPGIAVGVVHQLRHDDFEIEERAADPAAERRALDVALAAARGQLGALRSRLAAEAGEERAAIFDAHRELLADPELLDVARAGVATGETAAFAWRGAYARQADRLVALQNPVLSARAADLRDVGRRVLYLLAGQSATVRELPRDAIIVAEELSPSDTASLDRTRVRGVCTTSGGATSHAAILARGLGIPAVAGIDPRALALVDGSRVVIDGDAGLLRIEVSDAEAGDATRRQAARDALRRDELASAGTPAITTDGHRIEVVANLGDAREAGRVAEVGGEGVGLLRSEFLFMDRQTAPDEEEQFRTYEAIARALGPDRRLIVRTLDVGGDKPVPYLPIAPEANPFLGERGIRLSLARPELFRAQLRAILRASRAGRVAVMFPMVATLAEWREARALLEQERTALGVPPIPIGIMVETASAALIAEHFAREADFFSIGTNDLTQYALAMDRGNARLAPQVDALHPAVLRLIASTVEGARAHGRWVGVCGALAGDPMAVPVLLGLGVTELSADLPLVPTVKARVRGLSLEACVSTAREALAAADPDAVRAIVARRHPMSDPDAGESR